MGIKYHVNEKFFDAWSDEMAYVLGFWYADGSIEYAPAMRGHYLRVSSTDKSVIISIHKMMQSEHSIVTGQRPNAKASYLLRIGSKQLFSSIKKLGVTERKSNTLTFPNVPQEYFPAFIRGYFDGDGCVYIERDSVTKIPKRLTTVFTCGSSDFLESLQQQLYNHASLQSNLKIANSVGGFGHAKQLRYSTRDSVKLFKFMYKHVTSETVLDRKFLKFYTFFSARKHWIDSEIQSILSHT